MRHQLPSSALKKADGLDAHVQHRSLGKKCIFLFVVVLCPQVAPVFLFFFRSPVTRLLLRFAQTLASDLAVAKDQEEACHCLLPPSHPTVLPTWGACADVRAGVPSPGHAIHGAAVVKGATAYHIWRRGRTVLPPTTPSHTQSSGL